MADDLSKKIDGVTNSVNAASKKELDALSEISGKLDNFSATSASPELGTATRSSELRRKREQERAQNSNNSVSKQDLIKQERVAKFLSAEIGDNLERIGNKLESKQASIAAKKERKESGSNRAQNSLNSVINQSQNANASRTENRVDQAAFRELAKAAKDRRRDANGRFSSSADAAREMQDRVDRANKGKSGEAGTLRRLLSALRPNGDPLDGDAANAMGVAGGSTFWKAGKEIYDIGKGGAGRVAGAGMTLKDALSKRDGGTTKPSLFGRMFKRKSTSADAVSNSLQRQTTQELGNQTTAIKEGNQQIVDRLDELVKEKGGKGGNRKGLFGSLAGMLGGLAGGMFKIGTALAGRILAGLMSVLSLGTLKSLFGKVIGGGDGSDGGLPDVSGGGHRRGRRGRNKPPKKRGRIGKLFKAVAAGTAIAVTGKAVADSGLLDEDIGVDADESERKTTKPSDPNVVGESKAAGAVEKREVGKVAEVAAEKAAIHTATSTAENVGEKVAGKTAVATAEHVGEKLAVKGALKAGLEMVPVIGQIVGAGIDAGTGYYDEEGQKQTFGVDSVNGRQKAAYTTANVMDMGGLVSGVSGLAADGAEYFGMDKTAEALQFDTGDIAKSVDGKFQAVGRSYDQVKDYFSKLLSGDDEHDNNDEKRNAELVKAVQSSAKDTTDGLNRVAESFDPDKVAQAFSGLNGWLGNAKNKLSDAAAAVGDYVKNKYNAGIKAVPIANALNIGGANADKRNFRNNNFGNLNYVGQDGAMLEAPNAAGERRFAAFNTPEEGFRAMGNQLLRYGDGTAGAAKKAGHALNTIDDIFSAYAPESENNTEAYKNSVAKSLGVKRGDPLNLQDPKTMVAMVRAISTVEGGNPNVSDDYISSALGGVGEDGNWHGTFSPETLKYVNELRAKNGLPPIKSTDDFSNPESAKNGNKSVLAKIGEAGGKVIDAAKGALKNVAGMAPGESKPVDTHINPQPLSNAAGVQFKKANGLISGDSTAGKLMEATGLTAVMKQFGGDAVLSASGVRHQVTDGGLMAHYQRPITVSADDVGKVRTVPADTAIIPSKASVSDTSSLTPAVKLSDNQVSLGGGVEKVFGQILDQLKKITDNTKDIGTDTAKSTSGGKTAQPGTAGTIPLNISDPLMDEYSGDI